MVNLINEDSLSGGMSMEIALGFFFLVYLLVLLFDVLRTGREARKEREVRLEFYRLANESLSVWLVKNREEVS